MRCIWCLRGDHTVTACPDFGKLSPRGYDVSDRVNMLRLMNGQLIRLLRTNGITIPQHVVDMNPDRVPA
jgi:hypothetical protein